MTITAKYRGTCGACGGAIRVGDQIEWTKGSSRHTTCPISSGAAKATRAKEPKAPSAPREPKSKVASGPIRLSGGSGYGCQGWVVGEVIASNGRAGSTADLRASEYNATLKAATARLTPEEPAYTLWTGAPEASHAFGDTPTKEQIDGHRERIRAWQRDTDFETRQADWDRARNAHDQARRAAESAARAEVSAQFPLDDGPRWLVIVTASKRYVREDGLSFGVGDDSGYSYEATAREATAAEAEPYKAARRRKQAAVTCAATLASALKYDAPGVESVGDTGKLPPQEEREAEWTSTAAGDKDRTYVLTATTIVAHHGGYYDDYRSTTRTLARTEQLAQILRALAAKDEDMLAVLADQLPQAAA